MASECAGYWTGVDKFASRTKLPCPDVGVAALAG